MELFGVQELPNSKSIIAPGWAYIPDTVSNSTAAANQSSRKRAARNQPNASSHEHTARQDAKILRELVALDKESHRDVQIPVPVRHRDNAGRATHGKVTPAVRKILQSQKTFANHLSDAEALAALAASQPQAAQVAPAPASRASPAVTPKTRGTSSLTAAAGKRSHRKRDANASTSTPLRRVSMQNAASAPTTPASVKTELSDTSDVVMIDAPDVPASSILTPLSAALQLKVHPGDSDPFLKSHIPPVPSDAELEALIAAPPLTYQDARGVLSDEALRKPARYFCEICGYWGRVRCTKCGTRVCALECLRTHKEDCYTRYGA